MAPDGNQEGRLMSLTPEHRAKMQAGRAAKRLARQAAGEHRFPSGPKASLSGAPQIGLLTAILTELRALRADRRTIAPLSGVPLTDLPASTAGVEKRLREVEWYSLSIADLARRVAALETGQRSPPNGRVAGAQGQPGSPEYDLEQALAAQAGGAPGVLPQPMPLYSPKALDEIASQIAITAAGAPSFAELKAQTPILPVGDLEAPDPVAAMSSELAEYEAEDELIATTPVEVPPERLWGPRLELWYGSRMWYAEWGPRPGQEGCRCPNWLLSRR